MADTKTTAPGKKGREHYSHAKADARRDKRRQEAEARQRVYDKLSLKDKIALVTKRGGSKRELARLEKLAAPKAKASAPTPTGGKQ
jgi:hypothetical protein